MKNITLLLILSILLVSCSLSKFEKPFIIIRKHPSSEDTNSIFYVYQDKNGYVENFYDKDKYDIGDTIH